MCAPEGTSKLSLSRGGYGGSQSFLLPVAKGSATVDVPLSLDTQADYREEGREEEEELKDNRAGWTKTETSEEFKVDCPRGDLFVSGKTCSSVRQ